MAIFFIEKKAKLPGGHALLLAL